MIVEYNPFHNGHRYQVETARALYPDATLIAILGGNFLQRGEPALLDKYTRTRWALEAGVDLVAELPLAFGTQRADIFATGGVRIAASLGADTLLFGIEQPLDTFNLEESSREHLATLEPNQKLGFFYQQAIQTFAPHIKAHPIKRIHAPYNAADITHTSIASATAIRHLIFNDSPTGQPFVEASAHDQLRQYVPSFVAESIIKNKNHLGNIVNYFPYLKYSLLTGTDSHKQVALAQAGLGTSINKALLTTNDFSTFFEKVHHKHTSRSHIRRALTYRLWQVSQETLDQATCNIWTRILGLSPKGQAHLATLRKQELGDVAVPRIQKMSELDSDNYTVQYQAAIAYALITGHPIETTLRQENSNDIVFLSKK